MTISYNWLSEYLPEKLDPARLSVILTSVGLEVEKMEAYDEMKGGLEGLVIGQVLEAGQHPNADKLRLTKVDIGSGEPLQIVCGAPNVAAGQKVVVATIGTTIYPVSGEPLTMKLAKIRGSESQGMICAEDEIGIGNAHEGIMVLPADLPVGMPASEYFKPYRDTIYEIGLTPNRMDAMSHWGVARDVCAYLSHHERKDLKPVLPSNRFTVDEHSLSIKVTIENTKACKRYSGVCMADVQVGPSPKWLQDRLRSIGVRPINNIVDLTNFIQHETGQPLHAFDYDSIRDQAIIVKTPGEGTSFITLDEKERKLNSEDLMICDAKGPVCIAGVFGGLHSGVSEQTKNIFIESAYFDPVFIRKTSFRHGLRTDAATRFEKGIDISATVTVLKRAAMLVKEIAGGTIASDIVDVYPVQLPKKEIALKYHYLKKLSGKNYHPDSVKKILQALGFSIQLDSGDTLVVEVPYHKPDVTLPADLVEEILRIDGLDNIDIPTSIRISPSIEGNAKKESLKEKLSNALSGLGFSEILTNSITNSAYYSEEELKKTVRLLNNLSSELDIMRPTMLPTALEVLAFNINHKNNSLRFFEFGKTYATRGPGQYSEQEHLCLYITGAANQAHWKKQSSQADIYYIKGIAEAILRNLAPGSYEFSEKEADDLEEGMEVQSETGTLVRIGKVNRNLSGRFDIRQPVFVALFNWEEMVKLAARPVRFKEIPKYPAVERDLALVVPVHMKYASISEQINKLKLPKLREVRLFDVFESEKLGAGRKSLAVNFTFLDEEKTLTDKEIDAWMNRIMITLEKELHAEIRK